MPRSAWRVSEFTSRQSRAGAPQERAAGAARPRRPPAWWGSGGRGQDRGACSGECRPGLGSFSLLNPHSVSNRCLLVEAKLKGFSVTVCLRRTEAARGKSGGEGHFVQARSGLRLEGEAEPARVMLGRWVTLVPRSPGHRSWLAAPAVALVQNGFRSSCVLLAAGSREAQGLLGQDPVPPARQGSVRKINLPLPHGEFFSMIHLKELIPVLLALQGLSRRTGAAGLLGGGWEAAEGDPVSSSSWDPLQRGTSPAPAPASQEVNEDNASEPPW